MVEAALYHDRSKGRGCCVINNYMRAIWQVVFEVVHPCMSLRCDTHPSNPNSSPFQSSQPPPPSFRPRYRSSFTASDLALESTSNPCCPSLASSPSPLPLSCYAPAAPLAPLIPSAFLHDSAYLPVYRKPRHCSRETDRVRRLQDQKTVFFREYIRKITPENLCRLNRSS